MLSPTSLTRSQQRPLRRACPEGGSVGITTFLEDHTTEAGSVYSPAACLGDASHTWSGMTSRKVPISSFGTAMVTTFIDNSQKLPISASLAPHPVCCYQNLRKTSRLLRPFRGTCSTGFAPLRCRRRTPFQAIGGHTPSPASRLPDGQDNDLQDTGSRRDNVGFLQANSLKTQGHDRSCGNSMHDKPCPCGGV